MAKKSFWGVGSTILAAVTGAVAGAVGMFLADDDNRTKVGKEVRRVEHEVEKDWKKVQSRARKTVKSAKRKTKRRR